MGTTLRDSIMVLQGRALTFLETTPSDRQLNQNTHCVEKKNPKNKCRKIGCKKAEDDPDSN